MKQEIDELKIEYVSQTKKFWINQEFISDKLKNELKNSDILFVPDVRNEIIGFYDGVYPFYEYLEEQKFVDEVNINFCIEDEDFKEFHLHADILWMGRILIEHLFLPLFINLFSDYISNHFFHSPNNNIDIQLLIEKSDEKNLLIKYKGSCDDFIKIINDDNFLEKIDDKDD